MNVSAIIVTRGDVVLTPIVASLPDEWEVLVWNNGHRLERLPPGDRVVRESFEISDLSVYGRYAAIEKAKNPLIFVQDDDVLLPRESIETILSKLTVSDPHAVVCNMPARFRDQPQYERGDSALVGFGACFHRDAPCRAFGHLFLNEDCINPSLGEGFIEATMTQGGQTWHVDGDHFHRTCDIVFTALTPRVFVDVPYEDLPHAHAENRMWKQPQHVEERMRMLELVRKVRGE